MLRVTLTDEMTFRYIKLGYENRCGEKQMLVVVTDLLDPETHPAEEVADLYLRRWEIEVKLRDLKTTLRMEMFRVKSPEMAHRTLLMMQISYNLIRALMQEGSHHGVREILAAQIFFCKIVQGLLLKVDLFFVFGVRFVRF